MSATMPVRYTGLAFVWMDSVTLAVRKPGFSLGSGFKWMPSFPTLGVLGRTACARAAA
ncbi:MAG: hypothetical protein H8E44_41595 [Planctomycetes bacterium]|nr:hypothetical protein [Planctomycetota bacterium]MBL7044870.1 hypothetical protein [Pirellulaceae bacterium]